MQEVGFDYHAVAVFGAQSSGKSRGKRIGAYISITNLLDAYDNRYSFEPLVWDAV